VHLTLHVVLESHGHDHSHSCSQKQECTAGPKFILNAHRQVTAFQPIGCHLPAKKETLLQHLQLFITEEITLKQKEHNNAMGYQLLVWIRRISIDTVRSFSASDESRQLAD
jgi:hypothetical protein